MTHDSDIIMSAPMVQALLRQVRGEPGGKTQTRRVLTTKWAAMERLICSGHAANLYVRETFFAWGYWQVSNGSQRDHWRFVDLTLESGAQYHYAADSKIDLSEGRARDGSSKPRWWKRPSIHMPRLASRLTLVNVTARRERLGDISEADARAEGLIPMTCWDCDGDPRFDGQRYDYTGWHWDWSMCSEPNDGHQSARHAYMALWNHLHGPNSWDRDADKEVMVISFRPVLANIDTVGDTP